MIRVDVLLVERGYAPSRNRAQELIASGRVFVLDQKTAGKKIPVKKPSLQMTGNEEIQIEPDAEALDFVSRGGLKMQGALSKTGLIVEGFKILDVGISTGGFTDCLLQAGAASVVGVDVGHGQLAEKLKRDERVKLCEGVNARDLSQTPVLKLNGGSKFDLIVADVSFISLTLVLPEMISYLKESGSIIALVKPQFEVGRENLGKNGIVKDASLYSGVETKIRRACEAVGLIVEDYFESSIEGFDGNREFFVYAKSPELTLDLFSSSSPHKL
jgi:23S rRNA (cytidine1920-2'-O)/16S rRNA (cytidine1409-2'-O)-methyltransferase